MKASLEVTDVGGLRGSRSFALEPGKVNVIESANSAGKTSLVHALISVLSCPRNGEFSERIEKEAQRLGIKTDPENPREGFVNVYADEATAKLVIDGKAEEYTVKKNGTPTAVPKNGDERFLLSGVLSSDSRILRQLRGLDEIEA